jgi:hypothetical protein
MVDQRILKALRSDNPEMRIKAIKAMAKSQEREAIPKLSQISKSDPDGDVREMAQKAEIYIRKKLAASSGGSAAPAQPRAQGKKKGKKRRQASSAGVDVPAASGMTRLIIGVLIIAGGLIIGGMVSPWLLESSQYNLLAATGLEIASNAEGAADSLGGDDPLSFLPYLTIGSAGVVILLGLLRIFARRVNQGFFWFTLLLALTAVTGIGWFYFALTDYLTLIDFNASATDFLGTGFWLSSGGVLLLLLTSGAGLTASTED